MNLETYEVKMKDNNNLFWETDPETIKNILDEAILELQNCRTVMKRAIRHLKLSDNSFKILAEDMNDVLDRS